MRPFQRLDRAVSVLLILVSCYVLYLAVRMLVADVNAYQALLFLKHWTARDEVPSDRSWEVGAAAAQRAVSLYPVAHGGYSDRLGRIYEWKDQRALIGNSDAVASRESALVAYRKSVDARPYWPYTWSRIAAVKLKLLQLDDEFDTALRNAHDYGPWRKQANREVVEIGLTAWRELTPDQRQLVRRALGHLEINAKRDAKPLWEYAERLRIADQVREGMNGS